MITLASKRYTIAALGSTLDSRYPDGGASGFTPEAGFTVSGTFADGGSVTIAKDGGGFGASGPNIVVYADWHTGGTLDASIPTSDVVLGAWSGTSAIVPKYKPGRDGGKAMGVRTAGVHTGNEYAQFLIDAIAQFDEMFQSYALYTGPYLGSPVANQFGPHNFKKIWYSSNGVWNAADLNSDRTIVHLYGALDGSYYPAATTESTLTLGADDPRDPSGWDDAGYYISMANEPRLITNVTGNVVTVSPPWASPPSTLVQYYVAPIGGAFQSLAGANSGGAITIFNVDETEWDFNGWNHFQEWNKTDTASPYTATSTVWAALINQATSKLQLRTDSPMFSTGDYAWYDHINVAGYVGNFFLTDANLDIRFDDMYIATGPGSAKRFVLTDAATISASREAYICPHSSWADGQVTITLPYTEGGAPAGKHLHYYDESNAVTYVGSVSA